MKNTFIAAATALLLVASFQIGAQQTSPTRPADAAARPDALFTQQERDQFREKMRAAKTREERGEVRKQMRSTMEQRAKENGITLPQRRDHATGQRHGARGPQLLNPEERNQFRERMRSAMTPEERATVRRDMRGVMEQRAKEKGLTPPRGHEGRSRFDRDGRRPQLFTPDERLQYRDKMRAAKTPEERAVVRQQLREMSQQRAKEKGITLPERGGRGEPSRVPGPAGKS